MSPNRRQSHTLPRLSQRCTRRRRRRFITLQLLRPLLRPQPRLSQRCTRRRRRRFITLQLLRPLLRSQPRSSPPSSRHNRRRYFPRLCQPSWYRLLSYPRGLSRPLSQRQLQRLAPRPRLRQASVSGHLSSLRQSRRPVSSFPAPFPPFFSAIFLYPFHSAKGFILPCTVREKRTLKDLDARTLSAKRIVYLVQVLCVWARAPGIYSRILLYSFGYC
jgi:hypothetical protein